MYEDFRWKLVDGDDRIPLSLDLDDAFSEFFIVFT